MDATLRCRYNVAGSILIALGILFLVVGCASLYRKLGVPAETAEQQAAADQAVVQEAVKDAVQQFTSDLAAGEDLKVAAVKAGSAFIWQLATVLASGIGAVLSGLLATWLRTEKKITKAIITGVEESKDSQVKQSIQREAKAAGVESKLYTRVLATTGT